MNTIKVTILTIGDELLIGQVVDTNSSWMGETITREGFEIVCKQSIGDNKAAIIEALDSLLKKSDVVLITGGLGPTKDDITVKTLANYFNSDFEFNSDVYKNVERIILPRVGRVNAHNKSQAMVPSKARIFVNTMGTAPILWFEENNKVVVSMPGVPYEMISAMERDIIPALKVRFSISKSITYTTIVVTGITEAELAEELMAFEDALPENVSLAYLPSAGYIKLRLTGKAFTDKFEPYLQKLKQLVSTYLISEDEILPERILAKRLIQNKLTLSTAESCTGGNIAHKLTSVPGSSNFFKGSIVAYENQIKSKLLNVPQELIIEYGAVSEEVVKAMAINVCLIMNTNIGIATSGIAGPDGGTKEKPVGTVWVAWCINGKTTARKMQYPYTRTVNIERTTSLAILECVNIVNRIVKN